MTNKLNVLIVEDDEKDSNALIDEINANSDRLCVAGVTKSSHDALAFIRNHKPHAVILDLELQDGRGDGMELLDNLRTSLVCTKPYIVVNTNSASKITCLSAKKKGADYTFAKWQNGYSPKMVINHLISVTSEILGIEEEPPAPLTEKQLENKMREFIQDEFNKLGLSVKNKGYDYLVDAVLLAVNGQNQNWGKIIGDKLGINDSNVTHAMQYALNRTWTNSDINNLQKYYTAPFSKGKYVPTTNEFVFFYKQKLLNYLNK